MSEQEPGWQRLDPRMMLVNPITDFAKFVPTVIPLLIAGTVAGAQGWQFAALALPAVWGLLRYLTTTYRVSADRVELRRGLLNRRVLTVPLDRVRTVDLTASLVRRLLGLSTVKIGTGTASTDDDQQLDLDSLPTERARELRRVLLEGRETPVAPGAGTEPAGPSAGPPAVVRFRPAWLLYAPFTAGGLAIAGAVVGTASQFVEQVHIDTSAAGLPGHGTWVAVVAVGLVGFLLVVLLLSVVAYAAAYWGLTLTHSPGSPWHLRRGLLTTQETSIDEERMAGVVVGEPLLLRCVRGARLSAIVTGLRSGSVLVPPAPAEESRRAATAVLGDRGAVDGPLRPHGPRARTRRYTRALWPAGLLTVAALVAARVTDLGWLAWPVPLVLVGAALLAGDRARALGHARVGRLLVARSGSLARRRSVLDTGHLIGWTLQDSWWQRRAGLVTAVATTAGGGQKVTVPDVPSGDAVALAYATTPELVAQFLADPR